MTVADLRNALTGIPDETVVLVEGVHALAEAEYYVPSADDYEPACPPSLNLYMGPLGQRPSGATPADGGK